MRWKAWEIVMDGPAALFVYGSLMPCGHGHALIAPYVGASEEATVRGVLYDLTDFPALGYEHDRGIVHGALVRLHRETVREVLARVDRYEGYRPDAPADSPYVRRVVQAQAGETEYEAWAYVLNPDCVMLPPMDRLQRVPGGRW